MQSGRSVCSTLALSWIEVWLVFLRMRLAWDSSAIPLGRG